MVDGQSIMYTNPVIDLISSEEGDDSSVSRVVPMKTDIAPDFGFDTKLTASLTSSGDGDKNTLIEPGSNSAMDSGNGNKVTCWLRSN